MTSASTARWESLRTDETRNVERVLRDAGFERVDAYRYNSASIRLRVVDSHFEGLSVEKRDAMVEPHLERLPERTQADIISLFSFTPAELQQSPQSFKGFMLNLEFEDPSPSML
jgi:uncharacterized protein Smg (DUF494 family)